MSKATHACAYCGGAIGENALYCPNCLVPIALPPRRRRPSTASLFLGVSLIFGSPCAWVIAGQLRTHMARATASHSVVHAASLPAPPAVDQAQALIRVCGTADRDFSTADSDPRPPIPFRVLTYNSQHLQFSFVPGGGAKIGDPPPYIWSLSGILDTTTNQSVSPQEAQNVMNCATPILAPADETPHSASVASSASIP